MSGSDRRSQRAFSLLELIVVIVVLGILSLLAVPSWHEVVYRSAVMGATAQAEVIVTSARHSAGYDDTPINDYYIDLLGNQVEHYDDVTDSVTLSGGGVTVTAYINPETGEVALTPFS